MRARWRLVGGTSIVGLGITMLIVGHSRRVAGDTTSTTASTPSAAAVGNHDPHSPYPLGPGAIPYDELSAADRIAVDQIQETVETSQPPSSHQAWATASAGTGRRAKTEIAARNVGLLGVDEEGVVP